MSKLREWDYETEGTALALGTFENHAATTGDNDLLRHKQADTGAIWAHFLGIVCSVELGKQILLQMSRYTNAIILHGEFYAVGRML